MSLKHIELGTKKWYGAETLQKEKRVTECLKTAQAIELSRLFFDCIIKTVKDDYSILLYQNGTFEFQRKIVNVISRPTPTHFLTFFFINGKYVKQHSFSVLVNFYEFKKLFLFKSYSNSSLNKCMVVFNHF